MSANTNPDRIYVDRQHRAKIRMVAHLLPWPSGPSGGEAQELGFGAILVNLSPGGCCLQIPSHDCPPDLTPGCPMSSIKLLHPNLDSTPIKGRVAWTRGEPPYVLAGIQFMQLHSATERSIRSYLKDLTPPAG